MVTAMVIMLSQTNLLVGLQINQCTSIYTEIGEDYRNLIRCYTVQIARLIFWNAKGYGWSIGKTDWLVSGRYLYTSGLDTDEPWQGEWGKYVTVDCIKGEVKELEINTMLDDLDDDNVSGNGVIDSKQSSKLGYFPLIYLIQFVRKIEGL